MTANPWHSADRVKHKSCPVIFSNLFLLSSLFMEGEYPFFFTLEQEEFFTDARTHYQLLVLSVSLFSGCQSRTSHFLLIMSFYGSFLPALYGWGYMQSCTCIALAVRCNIYLYILRYASTYLSSVANYAVAVVVRMKIHEEQNTGRRQKFLWKEKLIAISREIFSSVFLPPLVMLIT